MTPETCPKGTRALVQDRDYQSPLDDAYEITVIEWSPEGRVKLRYQFGTETWESVPPYLVEILEKK